MGLLSLVLEHLELGMTVQKLEQSELWSLVLELGMGSLVLELGMGSGVEFHQMACIHKVFRYKYNSVGTCFELNESIITCFL